MTKYKIVLLKAVQIQKGKEYLLHWKHETRTGAELTAMTLELHPSEYEVIPVYCECTTRG